MTLFRKVFPSQARPATEDETINEDALRAAFTDMDSTSHPLVLDPFAHGVSDEDASDQSAADLHAEDTQVVTDVEDAEQTDLAPEETAYDEDTFEHGTPVESLAAAEDQQTETDTAQSDEEIAACLDRALSLDGFDQGNTHAEPGTTTDAEAADWGIGDDPHPHQDLSIELNKAEADFPERVEHDRGAHPAPSVGSDASDDMQMLRLVAASHGADNADGSPRQQEPETNAVSEAVEKAPEASGLDADQAGQHSPLEHAEGTQQISDASADAHVASEAASPLDLSQGVPLAAVPGAATGRASRRAGRVKTRLLGFNRSAENESDPFEQTPATTATAQRERFPVGWLVIVEGPGVGHAFSLFAGASMIGRGEDQVIRLDFGDNAISRQNHAAIAYDEEQNKFYLGHGGKSNIIRRNARPVLSTEELHHADLIRIGETTLRFVALCGSDFQWHDAEAGDAAPV